MRRRRRHYVPRSRPVRRRSAAAPGRIGSPRRGRPARTKVTLKGASARRRPTRKHSMLRSRDHLIAGQRAQVPVREVDRELQASRGNARRRARHAARALHVRIPRSARAIAPPAIRASVGSSRGRSTSRNNDRDREQISSGDRRDRFRRPGLDIAIKRRRRTDGPARPCTAGASASRSPTQKGTERAMPKSP